MRAISFSLVMILGLVACGQQKPPPQPKTPANTRLFDMQRDELQRAKGVEKTLRQQSQAQQQAVDQQSQ
ncbi:MAG: hypothetical protein ACYCY1_08210 [Sulfuriferula sp.]